MQARFAVAVMQPLTPDWSMRRTAPDGRPMDAVSGEFIKPNDRLSSFERLEIYNRQYWYRLNDIMYEDYPGLAAVLGRARFNKLCQEYLSRYPSRSPLLRNLGKSLQTFLREEPSLTAPWTDMALDVARFEYAQIDAFDAAFNPPLTPDDLLGKDPATTCLTLQPYITLLHVHYAVDHLQLTLKNEARTEASNASTGEAKPRLRRRSAKREELFLAVHRLNNVVFIKRLPPEAYTILTALRDGLTIIEAIECGTPENADPTDWAGTVRDWFQLWMSFGWFCKR